MSNPKSYYNQPDYSDENTSRPNKKVIYKPNEISSSDLLPPPPYTPPESSIRNYESIRQSTDVPPEQVGLLSQPRSQSPHSSPEIPHKRTHPLKKICFGLFFLLLLIGGLYYHHSPPSQCPNSDVWTDLPSIDFRKNLELIMEGTVTSGHVRLQSGPGQIEHQIRLDGPATYQLDYPQDDTTRLLLRFPSGCVEANVWIQIGPVGHLKLDVLTDVTLEELELDRLEIETTGEVRVGRWSGRSLRVRASEVRADRLVGQEWVLEGSVVGEDWVGSGSVLVKGDRLEVGRVEAESIDLQVAKVWVGSLLAERISVQSANGRVGLDRVQGRESLAIQAANGPVSALIVGDKNSRISVIESNADVDLHLTNGFEGNFIFSTSQGSIVVENTDSIEYQDDLDHLKRGTRKGSGHRGELVVQNANGDIKVTFDSE